MGYFDHFANSKSTKIGKILHDYKVKKDFKYISRYIIDKKKEILEIGPGKGDIAKKFIKDGYINYDVIEPNVLMGDNIKIIGVRNLSNYKVPKLKEKDSSYDIIMCFDVFEHLNDSKDAQLFMSEVERVLRNKGLIILLSPDYLDWREDFFNCDFSHNNVTTVRRTIELFYNNNLTTLNYKYIYSCVEGIIGKIINRIVKIITLYSKGNSLDSKLYKLRLTFLRRFIIIGQKIN